MIKNLFIIGAGIICIALCMAAIVVAIKNYRVIKDAYKKGNKKQEERLNDAMRFYLLATQLKYKIRSGWDENHWNISKERIESIAEHVYGTCI